MKHTICYIDHNKEAHDRWLGPSLANLKGDFTVLSTPSGEPPAKIYNDFLDKAQTDTVILLHQDMSFGPTLLLDIEHTIGLYPDYGSLGLVGAHQSSPDPYSQVWANTTTSRIACTFDACCLVVNRSQGVRFSPNSFKGLHLYVEDYCAKQHYHHKRINRTIILINNTKWDHHGITTANKEWDYNEYGVYKSLLEFKYPGVITT